MSELKHYGMPRRSGRYPWGSGKDPYQSAISFRGMVDELRGKGLSEKEIARGLNVTDYKGEPSISRLRALISINNQEIRAAQVAEAIRLQAKGMSNVAIGRQMGINESSVRSLLDPVKAERAAITQATANMLKNSVSNFGYIDVGAGVENHVGVSRTKLNTAIAELEEQGYKIHRVNVPQLGMPGKFTIVKVLGGPDSDWREVVQNPDLIQPILGRSEDFGRTFSNPGYTPIQSIKSDKVMIRYREDGGEDKDGVIELRRGHPDLDLGSARYAQVRIGVDGTHYMKGMAIYAEKMPDGVDIIYNTNKTKDVSKLDVMKKMEIDKEGNINLNNPNEAFGSTIGAQRGMLNVIGSTGKPHEEGTWDDWSRNLSSQFLSKQPSTLIKTQLDLAYQVKKEEFDEIMTLTNPTVKRQLLNSFGDDADAAAVHLQAAALPRQSTKVILPITNMKETEIYAPDYRDGETVVLIRHPHGGLFEIPQLTVNNNSSSARSIMDNARDAVGINPKVARKLSGADFDGDNVIVIPNPQGKIKTQASIRELQEFDPRETYKGYDGMPKMTSQIKGLEMGKVSNLITDMTIRGANTDEIIRAVKHSMVVIDAEKHNLNYRQSYIDNGIASLSEKYQRSASGGASTVVSQANAEYRIPERKEGAFITPSGYQQISKRTGEPTKMYVDPKTGAKLYTETGATYIKRTITPGIKRQHGIDPQASYKQTVTELKKQGFSEGDISSLTREKVIKRETVTTKMAVTTNAHELSSGTIKESIYADHANRLKALANTARKEALTIRSIPYSPSAKNTYAREVADLNHKLNVAKRNSPIERQAQIIANAIVTKKKQGNPGMGKEEITKVRNQALMEARTRTGAKKQLIDITPREWEAIQAGAVSSNTLTQILNNTDTTQIKQYATPRQERPTLTSARISKAESMLNSGFTLAEVADKLGVSISTLNSALYK